MTGGDSHGTRTDRGEATAAYAAEPCNAAIGLADAEYVLAWLRQTNAPKNVIGLQERAIRVLIATEALRVLSQQYLDKIERVVRDAAA